MERFAAGRRYGEARSFTRRGVIVNRNLSYIFHDRSAPPGKIGCSKVSRPTIRIRQALTVRIF